MSLESILNICIKNDLVLNNQQWLICHKTKPNNLHEQDVTQGQFLSGV